MMMKSAELGSLAAALAKAQGEMEAASKDKVNPHFKSKYADLGSIWDAIRAPLTKNGLSVVQLPHTAEDGTVRVTTILLHSSGQFIEASYCLPATKQDAQGFGSAITYMKRYALTGMGVAPEDDDGNLASQRSNGGHSAPPPARHAEPRGEASAPPDSAVVAFLKGKNLTLPIPGARAGKPDLKGWALAMGKAIDACPDIRTLDDLWGMNTGNLADLQKVDVQARVALEQRADEKRASLTQPTFLAAE